MTNQHFSPNLLTSNYTIFNLLTSVSSSYYLVSTRCLPYQSPELGRHRLEHFPLRLVNYWIIFRAHEQGQCWALWKTYTVLLLHWRMLHCKAPLYKVWNTHVDDLMLYWHAQAITSFHLLLPSWITRIFLFIFSPKVHWLFKINF